jgi:hypothetical protein
MLHLPQQRNMIAFSTKVCVDDIQDNSLVGIHVSSVTGNSATNGHSFPPYSMVYADMLAQIHATRRIVITTHPCVNVVLASWDTSDTARGGVGQIVCVMAQCHPSAVYWDVHSSIYGNFYWFTTNTTQSFKNYCSFDSFEKELLCKYVDLFHIATPQSDDGCSNADTLKPSSALTSVGDSDCTESPPHTRVVHKQLQHTEVLFVDKLLDSILNTVEAEHPDTVIRKGTEVTCVAEANYATRKAISTNLLLALKSCLLQAYDLVCSDDNSTTCSDDTHELFPGSMNYDTSSKKVYRSKLLQFGYFKKTSRIDSGVIKKLCNAMQNETLVRSITMFIQRCMCDMYVPNNHSDSDIEKGTPWIMWRDLNASFVTSVNACLFTTNT